MVAVNSMPVERVAADSRRCLYIRTFIVRLRNSFNRVPTIKTIKCSFAYWKHANQQVAIEYLCVRACPNAMHGAPDSY